MFRPGLALPIRIRPRPDGPSLGVVGWPDVHAAQACLGPDSASPYGYCSLSRCYLRRRPLASLPTKRQAVRWKNWIWVRSRSAALLLLLLPELKQLAQWID